jgi:methylated-DNA-[protein]-cysteine S-methyltransferase
MERAMRVRKTMEELIMDTTARHGIVSTPIGDITLVASGDALTGLYFPRPWFKPDRSTFGQRVSINDDALLTEAARQLDEYLNGQRTSFALPTKSHGDAFQERIWALISEIPYGETAAYGDLAARYGDRSLAREVGQAVGSNPLSLIVPCHRVVGKGNLGGYGGGIERKKQLLTLEGVLPDQAGAEFQPLMLDGFAASSAHVERR